MGLKWRDLDFDKIVESEEDCILLFGMTKEELCKNPKFAKEKINKNKLSRLPYQLDCFCLQTYTGGLFLQDILKERKPNQEVTDWLVGFINNNK